MGIESTAALVPMLDDGADAIARLALAAALDGLVPPPDAVPTGFRALAAVQAACRRAAARAGVDAGRLVESARDALLDLRLAELRQAPFSATAYDLALEQLRLARPPLPADRLGAAVDAHLREQLERSARRLERASRRPRLLLRGWAVTRARARVMRQLKQARTQLEDLLAGQVAGLAAAALSERVRAWRDNVAASRLRLGELRSGDGGRLRQAVEGSAIHRRRTAAGHAYSVPPDAGVVRAYAAARESGLLDSGALPGRSFWPAFGSWLAARRWLAPEQGPAAMEQALRAFVDGVAGDLFPDDLTLGDLYRAAGRPLDVGTWRRMASPRVTAHPEAQPVRADSVVELPAELSTDPAWSALGDARRRIGEDPRRILIATIATGFSLGELLRGDLGPLDSAVLGELAERAGTPVLADALRRHLPAMLRVVEPVAQGPATAHALPPIGEVAADGRAGPAG